MPTIEEKITDVIEFAVAQGIELKKLSPLYGLLGEIEFARECNGVLAPAGNQPGWDVEAPDGVRFQVKTFANDRGGRKIRRSTAHLADFTICKLARIIDGKLVLTESRRATREEVMGSKVRGDFYELKVPKAEKGMAEMSKVYDETGRELYVGAGDREHD
jgi:hypothetical protein